MMLSAKPENFDYVPDPVDYTKSLTPEPDFLSEEPFTDDLGKILESMMQIYGEEMGKEILAMELAMQNRYYDYYNLPFLLAILIHMHFVYRFEQKCDEFKAKLWPSLPLNLSFNNGPVSL